MKKTVLIIAVLFAISATLRGQSIFSKGIERQEVNDYHGAINHYKNALAQGESNEWIFINLVACFISIKNYDEAIQYARLGIKSYPSDERIKDSLMLALGSKGWDIFNQNPLLSEELFGEAFHMKPGKGMKSYIYNGYGCALSASGNLEKLKRSIVVLNEAFQADPNDNYLLPNLMESFNKTLRITIQKRQFSDAKKIIDDIYSNYASYSKYFIAKQYSLSSIHHLIDAQFHEYFLYGEGIKDCKSCADILSEILANHPNNYFLRHTYGACIWNSGNKERGFSMANQVYDDYCRDAKLSKEQQPIIEFPIKGKIIIASGWNSKNGYTHHGLWRFALDLILLDEKGNNVCANAPVYAPANGKIVDMGMSSATLSYIAIDIGNGLTLGLVHLKPGSARVKKGEKIQAGMEIAKLAPLSELGHVDHLHLHIFNADNVTNPFKFKQYKDSKGKVCHNSIPEEGEIIFY